MAFQGDGTGNISFPDWSSGTGDFKISGGNIVYPSTGGFQTVISPVSGSSGAVYADSGGLLNFSLGANLSFTGFSPGDVIPITIERIGNDVHFTAGSQSNSVPYAATSIIYGRFFSLRDVATLRYEGLIGGIWKFENGVDADRSYDFNQASGTNNLPDSGTLSAHGTLNSFITGDYDGAGIDGITITSHVDGQFVQRANTLNSRTIVLSGDVLGSQPSSIEVSVDFGEWTVIDSAPTSSAWSGSVTLTGAQFVRVRSTGVVATTQNIKIIVGAAIVFIGDSNQQGHGLNNQPVNLRPDVTVPLLYKSGSTQVLSDPTSELNGGRLATGSTLPELARLYACDGVPVCFFNIGVMGSTSADWQKGGAAYDRIQPFVTAMGGIELVPVMLGSNDSTTSMDKTTFKANMNSLINDINADYGVSCYLSRFASVTGPTTTDILDGIVELISENSNAIEGGDLTSLDITIGAATGNDGVHIKQDADINQAANIIYNSIKYGLTGTSQLTQNITGMPAGNFSTVLFSAQESIEVHNGSAAYTTGSLSIELPVPANTRIKGFVDDAANPSVNGAYIEGVTV